MSLGILGSLPAAWLILTLLVLLIYLLTRCCDRKPRPKRSIVALKWTLAIFTLLCCAAVGVGLYGNDDVHNGLEQLIIAAKSIDDYITSIRNQTGTIESTLQQKIQPLLTELGDIFDNPVANQTARGMLLTALASVTGNTSTALTCVQDISRPIQGVSIKEYVQLIQTCETIRQCSGRDGPSSCGALGKSCEQGPHTLNFDVRFLMVKTRKAKLLRWQQQIRGRGDYLRVESQWPVTMAVLSILLVFCVVLLFGVARHSRCALITFSVFGLFAVIISWLMASLYLASSVVSTPLYYLLAHGIPVSCFLCVLHSIISWLMASLYLASSVVSTPLYYLLTHGIPVSCFFCVFHSIISWLMASLYLASSVVSTPLYYLLTHGIPVSCFFCVLHSIISWLMASLYLASSVVSTPLYYLLTHGIPVSCFFCASLYLASSVVSTPLYYLLTHGIPVSCFFCGKYSTLLSPGSWHPCILLLLCQKFANFAAWAYFYWFNPSGYAWEHSSRPKKLWEETVNNIIDHIKSFKSRKSHYNLMKTNKALGDLCISPGGYLDRQAGSDTKADILNYYIHCDNAHMHPFNQRWQQGKNAVKAMSSNLAMVTKLARELYKPTDLNPKLDVVATEVKQADSLVSALATMLDCNAFHKQYVKAVDSVCDLGLYGLTFMLLASVAAGIFFTVLVWVDSHTWIYIRKRRDYLQVDEQDPFLPPSAASQAIAARTLRSQGSYGSTGFFRSRNSSHHHTPPPTPPYPGTLDGRASREEKSQHGPHHESASSGGLEYGSGTSTMPGPNHGQYATLSKQSIEGKPAKPNEVSKRPYSHNAPAAKSREGPKATYAHGEDSRPIYGHYATLGRPGSRAAHQARLQPPQVEQESGSPGYKITEL
uniref:Protein tweety homolog n=1 Tax=Timema tahoe TaxID=61484 RepID=A0A7R9NUV4_9NEOP|nr:unnamed protein product [Timema tahoe]